MSQEEKELIRELIKIQLDNFIYEKKNKKLIDALAKS